MKSTAWLDGQPMDAAMATNRALNYGDGIFRTMLVVGGQVQDCDRHLQVLFHDCARLSLDPPTTQALNDQLQLALRDADDPCVLKLMVIRRGAGRGYRPAGPDSQVLLRSSPAPRHAATHWDHGIVAAESPVRLAEQPLLAGVKHLNRLEQVLASRDWPPDVDEVILRDARGQPASGSRSNLFWVHAGTVYTPTLSTCGVRGMMRQKVLDCAAALNLPCRVVDLPWGALLGAEEVFVTNSLIGIWPVRCLGTRHWSAPGPLTVALQKALDHPRLCTPSEWGRRDPGGAFPVR